MILREYIIIKSEMNVSSEWAEMVQTTATPTIIRRGNEIVQISICFFFFYLFSFSYVEDERNRLASLALGIYFETQDFAIGPKLVAAGRCYVLPCRKKKKPLGSSLLSNCANCGK